MCQGLAAKKRPASSKTGIVVDCWSTPGNSQTSHLNHPALSDSLLCANIARINGWDLQLSPGKGMHTVRFFLGGFSISINGMLANSSVFIIVILLNKQEKETHARTKQNHPFWLGRNLPGPVDGFYAVRWMLPGEMETHNEDEERLLQQQESCSWWLGMWWWCRPLDVHM